MLDISCGIRCLRTNLKLQDAVPGFPGLADHLFTTIPASVGEEGKLKLYPKQLDEVLQDGVEWAVRRGYENLAELA